MMRMFFRNTPKTAAAIKPQTRILWQQGEFNIKQAEEQTQTIRSAECDLVIRDIVWKMAEVPFGTAAVTSSVGLDRDEFPPAPTSAGCRCSTTGQWRSRRSLRRSDEYDLRASREDFSNDVTFHISESKVPVGVAVGQLLVIQPECMQQSLVEVVNVDLVFCGVVTVVIG